MLIHEIVHAVGLSLSDLSASVMFAYYNGKIELSDYDVLAVQTLYGKLQNTSVLPTLPTLPSPYIPLINDEQSTDTMSLVCDTRSIKLTYVMLKILICCLLYTSRCV